MDLSRLNRRRRRYAEDHLYFFSGTDGQCVRSWFEDIEMVAQMIHANEYVCLKHAVDSLISEAERWYQEHQHILTTWLDFKHHMIARFDSVPPRYLPVLSMTDQSRLPEAKAVSRTEVLRPRSLFESLSHEVQFRRYVLANCNLFDGNSDALLPWLNATGTFFAQHSIQDTHQIYAIRFLLSEDALDFYLFHDDLVHNFEDLRTLFLHDASPFSHSSGSSPLQKVTSSTSLLPSDDSPLVEISEDRSTSEQAISTRNELLYDAQPNSTPAHIAAIFAFLSGTSNYSSAPETWRASSSLPLQECYASRAPHHFHPEQERDYLLAKSISFQSSRPLTIPQTLSIPISFNPIEFHDEDSDGPAGSETWDISDPLPPQQSHIIHSSNPFNQQHEPLPPRSLPVFSDDALPTVPKTSSTFIGDPVMVSSAPVTGIVSSVPVTHMGSLHISQASPVLSEQVSFTPLRSWYIRNSIFSHGNTSFMLSSSLFSNPCLYRQFVFSAIFSMLLSIVWVILTSLQFIFRLAGPDTASNLHSARQLWHLMVP